MLRSPSHARRAATLIESAVAVPLTFFLIFALVVGGMGILRYQQTAHVAREAARYASVHGGLYAQENGPAIQAGTLPSVDEDYIRTAIIKARAVGLDPSRLQVTVNLNTPTGTFKWDDTSSTNNRWPSTTVKQNNVDVEIANTVNVTLDYQWFPEMFLVGPLHLTSTCVMPMSY